MTKTTPNEELRALIAEWRDRRSNHGGIPEDWAMSDAYNRAAEELEQVIEETEDTQKTAGSYNE